MSAALEGLDTTQLARDYAENGVVKIAGLCPAEMTDELSASLSRFRQQDDGTDTAFFGHGSGRTTARWMYQHETHLPDLLRNSAAPEVVAKVIGAARLFAWYDISFIHEPGTISEGMPWHHDISIFPFKGEQNPSLWIALSQVELNSSPLWCLKGSHRTEKRYIPASRYKPDLELPPNYQVYPDFDQLVKDGDHEVLTWTMNVGDALVIHPYTIHCAPGNRHPSIRRIAYTVRLMGEQCRWQPDAVSVAIPGMDVSHMTAGARPDELPIPLVYDAQQTKAKKSTGNKVTGTSS